MKISVRWLSDYVTMKPPIEAVANSLTMAGLEVEKLVPICGGKDHLFEIEITTNRPDWLSHIGVAREIAAIENLTLRLPEIDEQTSRKMPPGWKVELKDKDGCPYYTGVVLEGVEQNPTPDFMRDRLEACGVRCINLIVDITNYVLLETGQPLHAFDADLLGGREVVIRRARKGEKFTAINGHVYDCRNEDLVIADHDRATALAGVMGGADSEVSDKTRNIFLESAFLHPGRVRSTSKHHAITSESSYRFERCVDPEGVDFARSRALYFLKKYAKPRFVSSVIKVGQKPAGKNGLIHLTAGEVEKTLGVAIKPSQIAAFMRRLGLDVKDKGVGSFSVRIPSFRSDLVMPVHLIEEIARLYGYENIPSALPSLVPHELLDDPLLKVEETARHYFTAAGLYETVTFSLISEQSFPPDYNIEESIRIVNPQNKELNRLRPMLLPSLMEVLKKNANQGAVSMPFFEIANTYRKETASGKKTHEEKALGIIIAGLRYEKGWADTDSREFAFYDLKGMVAAFLETLGIADVSFSKGEYTALEGLSSESIKAGDNTVGLVGEVQPQYARKWDLESRVYYAEISLAETQSHVAWVRRFQDLSRFPSIQRDLAVVVAESVKAGAVLEEIKSHEKELIKNVEVFDLFRGGRIPKGCKSLAFRVTYQSGDKTLVSEEIQKLHTDIAKAVSGKFQATFQ
ncbi:MAG: phenylalanine--tRNA ligase subunit beta [Candidatus Omnitrophota bacterium]|nr:phenylalanine--tRNA ligase subunit beta [Candidatus Omnitrophota bacterium]